MYKFATVVIAMSLSFSANAYEQSGQYTHLDSTNISFGVYKTSRSELSKAPKYFTPEERERLPQLDPKQKEEDEGNPFAYQPPPPPPENDRPGLGFY